MALEQQQQQMYEKRIQQMMDDGFFLPSGRSLSGDTRHLIISFGGTGADGLFGVKKAFETVLPPQQLNERVRFLAIDTDEKTQKFAQEVLDHMRDRLSDYQEKYGDLYNLEATPAESTSYRLAKHDLKHYPDIITASKDGGTPYYTNSSHLPVGYTEDIFSALEVQDELQTRYTSGTVFHAFLGEKLPDWKAAASLVRKIAENFKLPYYTMSPTYSVCAEHGYLIGEHYSCPNCRVAEGLLNKAGIAYEKQIAEENLDLCRAYNVKGAPTLIITDGEQYQSYYSVPEIKKYIASV